MVKKRDRRMPSVSDRRVKTNQPVIPTPLNSRNYHFIFFLFFSILIPILSLYVYRTRNTPNTLTNSTLSVYERELVKPNTNYQEILTENSKVSENVSLRQYTYPILAYITPWNSGGYEMAKKFNSKLTHLSPVWYDLKSEGGEIILEGRHNADLGWLLDLRQLGHALVMPRVVLEVIPSEYLKKKKQQQRVIDLILRECKEMNYDGIVLESWSRWAAYGVLNDPNMRNTALKLIKQLGQALHENSLQLIYVIGPPRSAKLQNHDFNPEDLETLSNAVDGFSLMTYDFSGPQNPGPNAPLKWIQATVEFLLSGKNLARKIFIGINFYGNDFLLSEGVGGGAITGRDYLGLLEKYRPELQWEEKSEEHLFFYSDGDGIKHAVFYPSLMSIKVRLEEARKLGAGISIWEIGQGLDYFFDLL